MAASPMGAKVRITRQDLEDFPALRPPIKGRRQIIPNRDLPSPEILKDEEDQKVSKRKRKGTKGPSWERMEAFSSASMGMEDLPLPLLPQEKKEEQNAPRTLPKPTKGGGGRNEMGPGGGGRRRSETTPRAPPAKNTPMRRNGDAAERKKEKKREKRQLKRQREAACRQEQVKYIQPRTGNPSEPRQGQVQRDTLQPRRAADLGPASRTRARTRATAVADAGVPKAQPPSDEVATTTIADVRIPPGGWTVVAKDRRRGRLGNRSRSRGRPLYADVAAARPPQKRPNMEKDGSRNRPAQASQRRDRPMRQRQQQLQQQQQQQQQQRRHQQQQQQRTVTLKKPPKIAAVQVVCPPGQCAETMRLARERVDIKRLGIDELRPRRTGALLLEVPGTNGTAKADALARSLRRPLRTRKESG